MNNFVTKKKITTFLTYHGVFALVISILICFTWSYVLKTIDEVKPYERVNIFMETYGVDKKLENDIYDFIKENDETKLLYEVNIYQFASNNEKITTYYESFGKNADLLILIEEDLIDMKEYLDDNFLQLSDELLFRTLGDKKDIYTYYQFDNKNYALKIYDKDNETYQYRKDVINYTAEGKTNHNYYLLINNKSVNVGEFNSLSKTENALKTIAYLFGE